MSTETEHTHPWLTITFGIIVLAITIGYYNNILHEHVIYFSTVDIFKMYGWTVIIVGSAIFLWAYLKRRTFSKLWLLFLVLLCNIASVFYFHNLLKPLPSQFRFSLTNKTNTDLTELHVTGDEELKLNELKKNTTINFVIHEYSENSAINLICKHDNKTDTVNLAENISSSCGFYYDLDIVLKEGRLSKE